jgi:hypothetical protein
MMSSNQPLFLIVFLLYKVFVMPLTWLKAKVYFQVHNKFMKCVQLDIGSSILSFVSFKMYNCPDNLNGELDRDYLWMDTNLILLMSFTDYCAS